MKLIQKLVAFSVLGVLALPAFAAQTLVTATNTSSGRPLMIPENAVEVTPGVFSLGIAIDPGTGEVVEGFAIIHPREKFHHQNGHQGGSSSGSVTSSCYSFLASGAKWKTIEPWVVNTANTRGLDGSFVLNNLTADILEWEDAGDGILGNFTSTNILGNGSSATTTLAADTISPDNVNEVYFSDVSDSGAIAVTITWGIFGGRPSQRRLVEWDMVFDDVDFDWSAAGEPGKMDFENIAEHELGHAIGLGHPSDVCTEETMFRFADYGETKKRDLYAGDIAGANKLY